MSSSDPKPPRTAAPSNGKRAPSRPAGCLAAACPDVAAAGDVSALLAQVLRRIEPLEELPELVRAIDARTQAIAATVEGVKDGLNSLTLLQAQAARDAGTTLRLVQEIEGRVTPGAAGEEMAHA